MIKKSYLCIGLILFIFILSGCAFTKNMINVISREDGSGTRDAFTTLFDLTQKSNNDLEKDITVSTSEITNSTAVVLQTVSEDENAIGYMSMGSLNDHVKALSINNIEPTVENIKDGLYPIFRPFLLIKGNSTGELEEDFINYIQSKEGAKVIQDEGYLPSNETVDSYSPSKLRGKIIINGSSSVTPVIEALSEEYHRLNPQIEVEVQQTDSTTGISTISEGISTLGMSSRELKDEELENGLEPVQIAFDGLAVIVNNNNPIDNLSVKNIHDIYSGKITNWSELEK